jgi:ArsR family transcriptional regulator
MCLAQKPKNVTELISTCGLSQSAISQHLSKLREAGLVATSKSGTCVTYELKYKTAAEISQLLSKLQQEMI